MKRTCLMLGVLLCVVQGAAENKQPGGQKLKDVHRLLVLMDSGKLGIRVYQNAIDSFKQAMPQVPKSFWEGLDKEISPESFVQLGVPIYDRYFSHEDIVGLIGFYESPLGKKLVKVQPMLVRDLQIAGQQWGERLAKKISDRLKAKGYQTPSSGNSVGK
ncbi:MAG: DUF2059 domain-containing protein [Deltaproteobacteria bacterium]|nr:DUF2059 domain-containing protein [Deltaproteobacteria bacterium]